MNNLIVASALVFFAGLCLVPLMAYAFRTLARQGICFCLVCGCTLVAMANKPEPEPKTNYTITYENTKGAVNPNPTNFTAETEMTFAPLANVKGYAFAGWLPEGITKGTAGDLIVTALWDEIPPVEPVKTNLVTFVFGSHGWLVRDGRKVTQDEQLVIDGESATPPNTYSNFVVETGWRLENWDTSYEHVTSDRVINAVYAQLPAYKITYANLGGAKNAPENPTAFTEDQEIVFAEPGARKDYRFLGWQPDRIARGTTSNVTVTAQWKSTTTCAIKVLCDSVRGTVSGCSKTGDATLKLVNGKLTIRATAKKGYVFMGWSEVLADGSTAWVTAKPALVLDNTGKVKETATQAVRYQVLEDSTFQAEFITAEEELATVRTTVNGIELDSGAPNLTNLTVGVLVEWPVESSSITTTKVAVASLPSGLAYKNGVISGYPTAATAAGKPKETKITVTTGGKNKVVYVLKIEVAALPAWVVGSFTGPSYADAEATVTNGLATATVAKNGKLSMKQVWEGKSASFTANGFRTYDAENDELWTFLTAKRGKLVYTNEVCLLRNAAAELGVWQSTLADLGGYNWSVEPWKTLAKAMNRVKYVYEPEPEVTVTLTVSSSGRVSVAGVFGKVKASSSTVLLPLDEENFMVYVYLTPRNLAAYSAALQLHWNADAKEFEAIKDPE